MTSTAYVGVGANLGDAQQTVRAAIEAMTILAHTRVAARSSLFISAPIDAGGNDFVNAVAQLETDLTAQSLLDNLQRIELAFGRERPFRNAPRTLDLDLLIYDQLQMSSDTLQLPHPRMSDRAFVLLPLLELAPEIHIPGKGAARDYLPAVSGQTIERLP
ncbi:MAG: 2-amino-4-hydroxy-6-hydroxymethyldihydropteridine diphosphokinase [Pseudomonadota bacterium]|jgi:2-amino-4-hydroxy-6-hydroxymethyldihydropteridine diphosphokinase